MKPKDSDHHNGKKFFNPTHPETTGFWDAAKMLLGYDAKPWPKEVENDPRLNLSSPLLPHETAITFINHASVLVQLPGINLITDPVFSKRVSPFTWVGPKRVRAPGIAFDELPKIDIVLISHNHYDHLDIDAIKKLEEKFKPRFFVPLGDRKLLLENGATHVHEMDWWDRFRTPEGLEITFTPTQHFSGRWLFDRNETLWGSFVFESPQARIYFGGDAAYSSHYQEIEKRLGVIDIALLPIGAYEPRWFMSLVHMNPAESVQAHLDLKSKQSIGIHFGTFQLTEEAIDQPVLDLAAALKERNLASEAFITLPEGQTRIFQIER